MDSPLAADRRRAWAARALHGLTARRARVLALLVAVASLFGPSVATSYARGVPARDVVMAFLQSYVAGALGFFAATLAGLAAYNLTPARMPVRAGVAALAVALTAWVLVPLCLAIQLAPLRDVLPHTPDLAATWVKSFVLAGAGAAILVYLTHEDDVERALEREAVRKLELDRGLDEARLQATQAQIEPHFLFNTLANIRRLYQIDEQAAAAMLRQFSRVLGATLPRMRDSHSTLGRELSLALAYLGVQKIRMGDRLRFETDVPADLHDAELPPMMLSTLVENAIKHGLAPLARGGHVRIAARRDAGALRVRVEDSGRGLTECAGTGIGLANIERRLHAQHGRAAALGLEANEHGGVTATLELPLRFPQPAPEGAVVDAAR